MAYDLKNVKILIVEDMAPMLTLTVSLMKTLGFVDVHGARSVDDAFNLFRQHNHDIIITDWLMEPLDGLDMIRQVRTRKDSPNRFVPIILMTGYSDEPRVIEARDKGITEFLMKPYSARDMYARIVQIIEKPRSFVGTEEFFGPDRRRRKNFVYKGADKRDIGEKNSSDRSERKAGAGDENDEIVLRDLTEETKNI